MKKITIQKIMFSSGKVTVDFALPPETDPALIEATLHACEVDINAEYNELVCNEHRISLKEMRREEGACKGFLFSIIGLILTIIVIVVTKKLGLW